MSTTFPESIIAKIEEFAALSPATAQALRALHEDGQQLPKMIDHEGDPLHLSGFGWFDVAEESWDDGCGISIHRLAPGVFVEIGTGYDCYRLADSPQAVLSSWDLDNYGGDEAARVAFGLDPEIAAAQETDAGPFRVWVKYNFYSNHSSPPEDSWAKDDVGETLAFDTYSEASSWVEETEAAARGYHSETNPQGCYCLSHGEYAAPEFTICSI